MSLNKRDFREETNLNASEEVSLSWVAGKLGCSKSAVLRLGLIQLVEKVRREESMRDTGIFSEE